MSLFSKRNLLVGIIAFIIGSGAYAAIWGMPGFLTRSATVKSQVAAYLLDDRSAVNGLLLTSGDQLHFSPQTGEAVAAQIKVGDEVTATGHAGTKSNYGRELRVEQISANGRTITEAEHGPKHPPEPHDRRGPKAADERPAPPDAHAQSEARMETNVAPSSDADANQTQTTQPETFKASGTIQTHLVNGHGDVDGLILSSGEQMRFSPKVGKLVVAAEQGADTLVSVEGAVVRGRSGTIVRPSLITVGNQTIALGR
ncbi:MAG: hypothetical protein AUG51_14075 [Acidobacteria bacterium 13_1_20CM_3_53_8]|nr:MAG: hypothetical protein AUG51_14075 [Acidobacteria bacterium 13_1_20CM_3_53_8]